MASVVERLGEAQNRHDLDALLGCFAPDYRSEQPLHPNRGFGGREQVRKNWSAIFESFPDFRAELLRYASSGEVAWTEWHWTGSGINMRGVIVWARLYMEAVEEPAKISTKP